MFTVVATAASVSARAGAQAVEPEAVVKKFTKFRAVVPTCTTSLDSANPLPPLVAPPVWTKTNEPAVSSAVASASLARCQAPAPTR